MITKYEFDSGQDGLDLLILAAVHGNETSGTNACYKLIEELNRGMIKLMKGKLTLVPICNPDAYQKDVRSIDENLNRVMVMHDNPQSLRDFELTDLYFKHLEQAITKRPELYLWTHKRFRIATLLNE